MDSYAEFRLIPDLDFPTHLTMGALWSKLHRHIASSSRTDIGVSFPEIESATIGCGSVLRVHGAHEDLSKWVVGDWLHGMRDHLEPFEILSAPSQCEYRNFRRVQQKSVDQMRQRLVARHHISQEQAKERIPDSAGVKLELPFVMLRSRSTSQRFPIFVRVGESVSEPISGQFGSYGLSPNATVPWF